MASSSRSILSVKCAAIRSDERPALTTKTKPNGGSFMFVRKCCACALGLFIVTACGEIDDPSNGSFYYDDVKILDTQETQYSLVDGTAEADGVLAYQRL